MIFLQTCRVITHVGKLAIYMRAFLCVFSSGSGVIPSSEKTSGDPSADVLPKTIETWMDLSLLQCFDIKYVKWRIGRNGCDGGDQAGQFCHKAK